jgi:hypothetical protein
MYFKSGMDDDYRKQLVKLRELLAGEADFLKPGPLGARPPAADAVVFPQLLGDAFSFLRAEGLETFAPYELALTRTLCRSLAVKRELAGTRFLVYQDTG